MSKDEAVRLTRLADAQLAKELRDYAITSSGSRHASDLMLMAAAALNVRSDRDAIIEEWKKSREIFREAFAHISMHMNFPDGEPLAYMPSKEWLEHASVQNALNEERRLIAALNPAAAWPFPPVKTPKEPTDDK